MLANDDVQLQILHLEYRTEGDVFFLVKIFGRLICLSRFFEPYEPLPKVNCTKGCVVFVAKKYRSLFRFFHQPAISDVQLPAKRLREIAARSISNVNHVVLHLGDYLLLIIYGLPFLA